MKITRRGLFAALAALPLFNKLPVARPTLEFNPPLPLKLRIERNTRLSNLRFEALERRYANTRRWSEC